MGFVNADRIKGNKTKYISIFKSPVKSKEIYFPTRHVFYWLPKMGMGQGGGMEKEKPQLVCGMRAVSLRHSPSPFRISVVPRETLHSRRSKFEISHGKFRSWK